MINRSIFLSSLLLLLLSAPAYAKAKVFILAGQSNMAGGGDVSGMNIDIDEAVSSQVRIWDASGYMRKREYAMTWMSLKDLQSRKAADNQNKIGPEFGFAKVMAETLPADRIYLIKVARGGTAIARFLPHEKGKSNEYTVLMSNLENALAKIEGDYEIAGMIWMQGESDTKKEEPALAYEENLTRLISILRTKTKTPDLPVVVGRLTTELLKSQKFNWAFTKTVQAAQESVAKKVPNVSIINSDALSLRDDFTHFDGPGQMALGELFGEAMQQLLR
jgi:hypothetical protein